MSGESYCLKEEANVGVSLFKALLIRATDLGIAKINAHEVLTTSQYIHKDTSYVGSNLVVGEIDVLSFTTVFEDKSPEDLCVVFSITKIVILEIYVCELLVAELIHVMS